MKQTILIAITCTLLFSSCKKDKEPVAETIHRLKSQTEVSSGIATLYEYDTQNRISKLKTGNSQSRSEFSYSTGVITQNDYNSAGTLDGTRVHELNSAGFARKTTFSGSYFNTRTFNSHNQLLSESEYAASGQLILTSDYFYAGEKLDSMVLKTPANLVIQRNNYEYYGDITNTTVNQHTGLELIYGREYPQALKKLKIYVYDYLSGAITSTLTYDYTYEKDTQGRISKANYSGSSNGSVLYTYY